MTKRKPIVFLDVDDTILDFKKAEAKAVAETFRRLGIEPTDAMVRRYSEINISQWELLELGKITRAQVMTGRFDILFRELGIERGGEEAHGIFEKLLSVGHFFMPYAAELLAKLHGNYELYIVSNGTATVQAGRLSSAGILPYFNDVFISESMGCEKPARQYFQRCFERIPDFDGKRSIIVGDSLTSDIRGGINAGIKTCWYNYRQKAPREDIKPDYEIRELSELPPLLEKIFA